MTYFQMSGNSFPHYNQLCLWVSGSYPNSLGIHVCSLYRTKEESKIANFRQFWDPFDAQRETGSNSNLEEHTASELRWIVRGFREVQRLTLRWNFSGIFCGKTLLTIHSTKLLKNGSPLSECLVSLAYHIIAPISWGSLQFWKTPFATSVSQPTSKVNWSHIYKLRQKNNTETSLLGTFTLPLGFFSDGRTGGVLLAKRFFVLKTGRRAPYLVQDLTVQAVDLWIGMGCATCPEKNIGSELI